MAKGGARPGAGRKPKNALLRSIDGGAGRRPVVTALPAGAVIAPVEEFGPPEDLTPEQLAVWTELAPLAFHNRTLTKSTALAFQLLCRNVVLERMLASSHVDRCGSAHRGMIQRVDVELAAFSLRPFGKPIYEAEPEQPANPLEKFLHRKRG
jgi:hypothetical protein